MRFTMDSAGNALQVRRYGADGIEVGDRWLTGPCLVTAQQLVTDWTAREFAALEPMDLAPLFALATDLVLVGTRAAERIPPANLRREFRARGIALESMELGAACRTFNVLVQEGRPVLAALFPAAGGT